MALARPNWPLLNAVKNSCCDMTRVELFGTAAGVQCGHVDEGVQGQDAHVDVGGLDVVPDQRNGDGDGGAEPSGPVDPGRLEQFRRDALDAGHEEHHVEADKAPDDDEHGGDHRGAFVAEPWVGLELVQAHAVRMPLTSPLDGS